MTHEHSCTLLSEWKGEEVKRARAPARSMATTHHRWLARGNGICMPLDLRCTRQNDDEQGRSSQHASTHVASLHVGLQNVTIKYGATSGAA